MWLDLKRLAKARQLIVYSKQDIIVIDVACAAFMKICLTTLDNSFFYNIILKFWSKIKVMVTPKWHTTLCDPKMRLQTKFGFPMSNNIEFMLVTRFF